MATYLLLRNNKQRGPLSLQHLIQLGLKPYDLVWVEGKSAAWRYPSEIPELKPYSAAVEEQPFDRFFKKPEEKKETSSIALGTETPIQEAVIKQLQPEKISQVPDIIFSEDKPVYLQETKTLPEPVPMYAEVKNSVPDIIFPDDKPGYFQETKKSAEAVPMNAKVSNSIPDIVFPDEISKSEPVQTDLEKKHEKYYPKKTVYVTMPVQPTPAPRQEPVFKVQPSPASFTREEPVRMETKYSQPLDEIKEMYVQKLQERKHQSAKKKFTAELLKKAAIVIGIISVGVLIGFAIKPKGSPDKLAATVLQPLQQNELINIPVQAVQQDEISKQETAAPEPPDEQYQEPVTKRKPVTKPVEEYSQADEKVQVAENKKAVMKKQKQVVQNDEPTVLQPGPGEEINASTGERMKKTRANSGSSTNSNAETEETNTAPKVNIASYVSVKSNDYDVVAFGGIRNLQLTVLNDSKYVLDNVHVEVQYLKPNQQPIKSETVKFKSVAPGGSLTIRVPDTNRGMKVIYKVVRVESKEFKDMAGL